MEVLGDELNKAIKEIEANEALISKRKQDIPELETQLRHKREEEQFINRFIAQRQLQ